VVASQATLLRPAAIDESTIDDEQALAQALRSLSDWSGKLVKADDQLERASKEIGQRREQLSTALSRLLKTRANVEAADLAGGRTDDLLVALAVARQVYEMEATVTQPICEDSDGRNDFYRRRDEERRSDYYDRDYYR
jgi:hypothetical protein